MANGNIWVTDWMKTTSTVMYSDSQAAGEPVAGWSPQVSRKPQMARLMAKD